MIPGEWLLSDDPIEIKPGRRTRRISVRGALEDGAEPALDLDCFRPVWAEHAGQWMTYPLAWEREPEDRLEASETVAVVRDAMRDPPPAQQEVMTLRDVEGWTSSDICDALNISEANQRVLLHRARSKMRRALEQYFEEGKA